MAEGVFEIAAFSADVVPESIEGIIGPFPTAEIGEEMGAIMQLVAGGLKYAEFLVAHTFEAGIVGREQLQERWNADWELLSESNDYGIEIAREKLEFEEKVRQQLVKENELFAQIDLK